MEVSSLKSRRQNSQIEKGKRIGNNNECVGVPPIARPWFGVNGLIRSLVLTKRNNINDKEIEVTFADVNANASR